MDPVQRLGDLPGLGVDGLQLVRERLVQRGGDVPSVPERRLGHRGPALEGRGRLRQQVERITRGHAVVGEGQSRRASGGEALQRLEREVEVEVRRRCRRAQHAHLGQAHPDRVADEEQPALAVVQAEVVLGVPGRVDAGERPARADPDLLAVTQDAHPVGGRRRQPAVERVEQVAVDEGGRADQAVGVHQVASPLLVDEHRRPGEGRGDVADAARVVEVDVGHDDGGQVGGAETRGRPARPGRSGSELWLPVSTRHGSGPSTRYPAVTSPHPPSRVSICTTPGAMRVLIAGSMAASPGPPPPRAGPPP